jgi:hypothetical protein
LTRRTFDVFGEREAYGMPTADLSVTMDDGKTTVVPGTTDTYTIIVTNNGPDTLSSLTLIPGFRLSNPIFSPPSGRGAMTSSPRYGAG